MIFVSAAFSSSSQVDDLLRLEAAEIEIQGLRWDIAFTNAGIPAEEAWDGGGAGWEGNAPLWRTTRT